MEDTQEGEVEKKPAWYQKGFVEWFEVVDLVEEKK